MSAAQLALRAAVRFLFLSVCIAGAFVLMHLLAVLPAALVLGL